MDRFAPETIHSFTLTLLVLTIVGYLLLAYFHRRGYTRGRVDVFLRYRSPDLKQAPVTAELLRATLMASAFSLASAIYVYIDWSYADGMFVLWSPIAWSLGALALYLFRHRIFKESRDVWTMHAFLKKAYGSDALMKSASIVTSVVFLLQVAAEVYVGLAVLEVFFDFRVELWVLCLVIGAVFVSYSLIGGLPSVLITDRFQYWLTAFALLVVAVILFNDGGATATATIAESFTDTFVPSGSLWIVLLGLLALNLPLLITDMSVWQRVGAVTDEKEVTRGVGMFTISLLFWMSLIVCLGVGFATFFEPAEGLSPAQAMLGYFSDTTVFPVLIIGFVAALLSTGDTFLIASVQTLLVDWRYSRALAATGYKAERLSADTHRAMLRDSRLGTLILGFLSVLLGYAFFQLLPSLLDLLFVLFGLQTALAPAIVWGLVGKAKHSESRGALLSIAVGGILALVCLVAALQGAELLGVTLGLWAPIVVLGGSTLVFALGRRA